ncbi:hypothetical protein C8D87_102515 [Lentzea atacamensis]|uniref:Uncharacterized protein n=1 Tax=Lentzea atacamensis TaxID=531938 RepID=A0ABX9EGF0_9PSEU|nr:hypothetical protein C8D87_102515 [Lentzea atacamensis]
MNFAINKANDFNYTTCAQKPNSLRQQVCLFGRSDNSLMVIFHCPDCYVTRNTACLPLQHFRKV